MNSSPTLKVDIGISIGIVAFSSISAEGARARARRHCAERVERRLAVHDGEAHDAGSTVEAFLVPQTSFNVRGCDVDRSGEKVVVGAEHVRSTLRAQERRCDPFGRAQVEHNLALDRSDAAGRARRSVEIRQQDAHLRELHAQRRIRAGHVKGLPLDEVRLAADRIRSTELTVRRFGQDAVGHAVRRSERVAIRNLVGKERCRQVRHGLIEHRRTELHDVGDGATERDIVRLFAALIGRSEQFGVAMGSRNLEERPFAPRCKQ